MSEQTRPFPVAAFAASILGGLIMGLGIAGLFLPEELPALASPAVAWSLIGVGAVFDIYGVYGIVFSRMPRSR